MKTHYSLITSCFFVALFSFTAIGKFSDHQTFTAQLYNIKAVGPVAPALAWLLPSIEIITALMLLLSKTRFAGLIVSSLLMVVFTIFIAGMMLYAEALPCSCGGVLASLSWTEHLVFNIVCMVLAISGVVLHWKGHQKCSTAFQKIYCNRSGVAENLEQSRHK